MIRGKLMVNPRESPSEGTNLVDWQAIAISNALREGVMPVKVWINKRGCDRCGPSLGADIRRPADTMDRLGFDE